MSGIFACEREPYSSKQKRTEKVHYIHVVSVWSSHCPIRVWLYD